MGDYKSFANEIHLGNTFPLLFISGACQGVELKFESDVLTFGPVVKGGYPLLFV